MSIKETLIQLAKSGAVDSLEEKWLEAISSPDAATSDFLDAARVLAEFGEKDRAVVLLGMLFDDYKGKEKHEDAFEVVKALAEVRPNDKHLRPRVLDCVRAVHADLPALELLIEKSELEGSRKVPDALAIFEAFARFKKDAHVFHGTGWGTGRIIDFDKRTAELTVDFEEDKGHSIPIDSAREIFQILEDDDLRAYKFSRPDELAQKAKDAPAEIIRLALKMRGGRALASEIRKDLRGTVISESTWSKWWTKARREAAKDSFIEVQEGTKPAYVLREKPVTIADEALATVEKSRDLHEAVGLARGFCRKAKDSVNAGALGNEIQKRVYAVEDGTVAAGTMMAALMFLEETPAADSPADEDPLPTPKEFLLHEVEAAEEDGDTAGDAAGDDAGHASPAATSEGDDAQAAEASEAEAGGIAVASEEAPVSETVERATLVADHILSDLDIQEYRNRFVATIVEAFPDDWPGILDRILRGSGQDLFDVGVTALRKGKHEDLVCAYVAQMVQDPVRYNEAFMIYARGHLAGKYDSLPDSPTRLRVVLRALNLYEKIQRRRPPLEPALLKKYLGRIETMLLDAKTKHLASVLKETTLEEMTRIFNETEASPYLSYELKAAVHTTVARTHPVLLTDTGKPFWEEDYIYSTVPAIEAKQEEFRILTEIKIPENSRAVGAAASLGDLSENSEYTSALESQRLLTEKAEALRAQLDKARNIETQTFPEGTVAPGTKVRVRDESGTSSDYSILGPWDAGKDDSIISYLSPLAKGMLGREVGEEVEATLPTGTRVFVIEAVEPLFD